MGEFPNRPDRAQCVECERIVGKHELCWQGAWRCLWCDSAYTRGALNDENPSANVPSHPGQPWQLGLFGGDHA